MQFGKERYKNALQAYKDAKKPLVPKVIHLAQAYREDRNKDPFKASYTPIPEVIDHMWIGDDVWYKWYQVFAF